jgi:hypothetical protein
MQSPLTVEGAAVRLPLRLCPCAQAEDPAPLVCHTRDGNVEYKRAGLAINRYGMQGPHARKRIVVKLAGIGDMHESVCRGIRVHYPD